MTLHVTWQRILPSLKSQDDRFSSCLHGIRTSTMPNCLEANYRKTEMRFFSTFSMALIPYLTDIYYMDLVSIRYSNTKVMPCWRQQQRTGFYLGRTVLRQGSILGAWYRTVIFFYSPFLVWLSLQRMQQAVEWFRAVVNDYTLPGFIPRCRPLHGITLKARNRNPNKICEVRFWLLPTVEILVRHWCIARYHL